VRSKRTWPPSIDKFVDAVKAGCLGSHLLCVQAIFFRRRHQPRRPDETGQAPAMGSGTAAGGGSFSQRSAEQWY